MAFLIEKSIFLISIASFFCLLMAIGIGANDVANAMGTSVGSRAITVKQAIIIAIFFEFAGAYLAGGEVTQTIRSGIIDITCFKGHTEVLIYGMMSALLAAGCWLIVASWAGWPVSTTHSIIGAIIGFTCVSIGGHAVAWGNVKWIVASWLVGPIVASIIAYVTFISTQRLIFDTENPFDNVKRYGPFYIFLTLFIVLLVTLNKGLKHVGLHWGEIQSIALAFVFALAIAIGGYGYLIHTQTKAMRNNSSFSDVETVFGRLMLVTACAMAFAHGSNDVANAIGPLSAIVSAIHYKDSMSATIPIDVWVLALGGVGIVLGLVLLGHKVMQTVGVGITDLTPSRGFAAEFSAATSVVIASGSGLPISTTQILVGAVLGVGFARGIAALNLGVVRNIIISWIITLPISALICVLFYYVLLALFC